MLRTLRNVGFPADHVRVEHSASVSADVIASAHLFGAPPVADDQPTAPVSREPLQLAGTIATADPTQGFAIIGRDAPSARFYAVGSSLPDGATLRDVYVDHALMDRGGQIETLWMPRSSLSSTLTPHEVAASGSFDSPEGERGGPAGPNEIQERLRSENMRVAAAFEETALMNMDQFRGLKVESGRDPSILAQMGLKPGDIVQGVDGILVDLEHVDLLRKALASGRKFQLYVLRPQEGPVDLEIDAARFQGLVSN